LRGAQPSTPSRAVHSTRAALEREFNPAVADCGLQGTATSPSSTAKSWRNRRWRRGWDSNPRYSCPYTAFPVPHLRPLGHPSSVRFALPITGSVDEKMAEGRGFEPPRDLRPYPISSRTPSTGLGHPSASIIPSLHSTRTLIPLPAGQAARLQPSDDPDSGVRSVTTRASCADSYATLLHRAYSRPSPSPGYPAFGITGRSSRVRRAFARAGPSRAR
jgi:hypothetical protein